MCKTLPTTHTDLRPNHKGWSSVGGGGQDKFDGLVQERRNSIANAQELHLSCTNPSSWSARGYINSCLGGNTGWSTEGNINWWTGGNIRWCAGGNKFWRQHRMICFVQHNSVCWGQCKLTSWGNIGRYAGNQIGWSPGGNMRWSTRGNLRGSAEDHICIVIHTELYESWNVWCHIQRYFICTSWIAKYIYPLERMASNMSVLKMNTMDYILCYLFHCKLCENMNFSQSSSCCPWLFQYQRTKMEILLAAFAFGRIPVAPFTNMD